MEDHTVRISVILPSLNVERFIGECLSSVIGQTFKDMEIICVDAGSTDETLDIISEYADRDSRIRVINSDKKSYGYQMNLGIQNASGEYIGFVDTDDLIVPQAFETVYLLAQKTGKPDFVKGNHYNFTDVDKDRVSWMNDPGVAVMEKRIDLNTERSSILNINSGFWTGIYRRDFLLKNDIRFNETPGAAFQDTGFNIQVLTLSESAAFTDEGIYFYRIDNGGSSVKNEALWESVADEWAFIEEKLLKATGKKDPYGFNASLKIGTYGWNFFRLNDQKNREMFRCRIKKEIEEIVNDRPVYESLNERQRLVIGSLLSGDGTDEDANKKAKFKTAEILNDKDALNIVIPAGLLCKKLLFLQKITGKKTILGICDNDPDKHNQVIDGYKISKVEDAVKIYGMDNGIRWLTVSSKHSEEITGQLIGLGVQKDNIFIVDAIPTPEEMVEYLRSVQYET